MVDIRLYNWSLYGLSRVWVNWDRGAHSVIILGVGTHWKMPGLEQSCMISGILQQENKEIKLDL